MLNRQERYENATNCRIHGTRKTATIQFVINEAMELNEWKI